MLTNNLSLQVSNQQLSPSDPDDLPLTSTPPLTSVSSHIVPSSNPSSSVAPSSGAQSDNPPGLPSPGSPSCPLSCTPSDGPSGAPSGILSDAPSGTLTDAPSGTLIDASSGTPSDAPSAAPSGARSNAPSGAQNGGPSVAPIGVLCDVPPGTQSDSQSSLAACLKNVLNCVSDIQKQQTRTEKKIDRLLQQYSALQRPKETVGKDDPSDVSRTLFRSGRSISALQLASDNDLVVAEGADVLFCQVCNPKFVPSQHTVEKVKGIFRYPLDDGLTFGEKETLPPTFKSLRTIVKRHFTGQYHAKQVMKAQLTKKLVAGHFSANTSVAKRIIDVGYYVLKKTHAHATFEDLVVMQRRHGLDIGGLNNSVGFIPKLRIQLSSVMDAMMRDFFSRQPCVSLCADKVTVSRRTMDLTAIIAIVPEADEDNMVQAFVIGAPVVKDHTGDGLAGELQSTLEKFGIRHTDQLAAICMDGQYHHQKVPEKLLQRMVHSSERLGTTPCVATLWDGSHLLNLAEHDARSQGDCKWVKETLEIITYVTKLHNIGKGLEELLDRGDELGEKILHPKLWSGTRFAPYASRTLKVFMNNLPTVIDLMEEEVENGTKDTGKERELAETLQVVKGRLSTYAGMHTSTGTYSVQCTHM